MAAIVIENLSPKTLSELERRAAARKRSVVEELVAVVEESLASTSDDDSINSGPPFLSPPYDLPRVGERTLVKVVQGTRPCPIPFFLNRHEIWNEPVRRCAAR